MALTALVHRSVSRGLFDRHRLPFSTLIAASAAAGDSAAPPNDPNSLRHTLRPPPTQESQTASHVSSWDGKVDTEEAGPSLPLDAADAQALRHAWPRLQALARAVPAYKGFMGSVREGTHG